MWGGPYFPNEFVDGLVSWDVSVTGHPRDGERVMPGPIEPGAKKLGGLDGHRVAV